MAFSAVLFVFSFSISFLLLGMQENQQENSPEHLLLAAITTADYSKAHDALEKNADPNAVFADVPLLHRVLHSERLTRLLLQHGALPDKLSNINNRQRNALHVAVAQGNSHVIPLLLEHGANLVALAQQSSASSFATSRLHSLKILIKQLRNSLLKKAIVQDILLTALFNAVRTKNIPAACILLEEIRHLVITFSGKSKLLMHAFLRAVAEGQAELIPLFLENGIDINCKDPETNKSALDIALENKQKNSVYSLLAWGIFFLTETEYTSALKQYFKYPLDILILESNTSSQQSLITKIREFLKSNASCDKVRDYSFELFLHTMHRWRFSVVKALFRVKPLSLEQTHATLKAIDTALEILERKKERPKNRRQRIRIESIKEKYKNLRAMLHAHLYGSSLFKIITDSINAFQESARMKSSEEAVLLNQHTDETENLLSPLLLMLPIDIWHTILNQLFGFSVRYPSTEDLLWRSVAEQSHVFVLESIKRGCSVNIVDTFFATPLHRAAELGNLSIIELLLAHGAEIDPQDKDGKTPEEYARKNKHNVCAEYLHAAARNYIPEVPLAQATREKKEKLIRKFLKEGSEVNFPHDYRRNIFDIAESIGAPAAIIELLVKYGAQSKLKPKRDLYSWLSGPLSHCTFSGNYNAVEDKLSKRGNSLAGTAALSYAVASGNPDIVKLLLERAVPGYDQFREAYKIAQAISSRKSLSEEQQRSYTAIKILLLDYTHIYS